MGRHEREATVDCGALYERVRGELVGIVRGATAVDLATPVPAAPGWTVRDVLAHVTGLAAALNSQDFPAADDPGGVAWGERVMAVRAQRSVAELVAEWDLEAPAFEEGLRLFGYEFACHFVADLLVHLHDIQAALAVAPYLDAVSLAVALDHYTEHLAGLLRAAAWGTLVVGGGAETWRLGDGAIRADVRAAPYDVLRTLCARRSERQIRALTWGGDVDAVVTFLRTSWTGGYSVPTHDQP